MKQKMQILVTFTVFLFIVFAFQNCSRKKDQESEADIIKSTRTRVGQMVPDFQFTTDDSVTHLIRDFRGKVVVINFWANWCPPCRAEFPHLEKEIWQRFKDRDFYVIAIGREHTMDVVRAFRDSMKVTFPMAPDPKREIYSLFAEKYIPRTILVDKDGRIVKQIVGFQEEEFKELIRKIEELLKASS